jgi:hypothetical protein
MNIRTQTDTWISRIVTVLSLILAASVVGILILRIADNPVLEILVALGFVATGGLIRVMISPLSSKWME